MIYEVSKINGEPREWGEPGREMLTYSLLGKLDGEIENVQITTSKAKAKIPFLGEKIECEVSKDDPKYGKTIKRTSTGFVGGFKGHPEDPEKQKMIVRQNALGNAVQFLIATVNTGAKAKEELTTENVLLIATKFAAFSMGELQPKPPVRDAQQIVIDGNPEEDLSEYIEND